MKKREYMIKVTPKFNELKVNLNYDTGRNGENNCRIVSKGSELDLMYEQVYEDWKKVQEWNEKKRLSQKTSQIDSTLGFTEQEQIDIEKREEQILRDGAGEWILS